MSLTIADVERMYGSPWGKLAYQDSGLRQANGLTKADTPLTTQTSGAYRYIVGAQLWAQMNTEQNVFAALPKEEWNYSGIRVLTNFSSALSTGVPETGASAVVPDTVLPSFAQYEPTVKLMAHSFDATLQQMFLAQRGQGVTWEQIRDFMGVEFGKGINQALTQDVGTAAGDNFESIDRIATSAAEVTAKSLGTNADLYGGSLARSGGASWNDGTSLYDASADRTLSLGLLNDLWRSVMVKTGDYNMGNLFWLTGPDTYQRWSELLQPQQRFEEEAAQFSPLNGVEVGMTPTHSASFRLGVYQRSPILVSQDVQSDTISRVYLQHKDYLHLRVVQPIVYREVGVSTGQELLLKRFADEGLWYMAGELVTKFPGASGKLANLK